MSSPTKPQDVAIGDYWWYLPGELDDPLIDRTLQVILMQRGQSYFFNRCEPVPEDQMKGTLLHQIQVPTIP